MNLNFSQKAFENFVIYAPLRVQNENIKKRWSNAKLKHTKKIFGENKTCVYTIIRE